MDAATSSPAHGAHRATPVSRRCVLATSSTTAIDVEWSQCARNRWEYSCRPRLHRSMWAIRRTRILPVCRTTKRPRRSRRYPMNRKCVGSEWRTDRPPPTKVLPRHRRATTVFGGGGRGRPRPYGKVGTLMERGSHFGRLGRWLGDVGRDQPSERRRRDHGSDGRAGSSRRGRRGGVVGWPKRRPARGPLGVPRVVLRVSSGRPELRPAPRRPLPRN
jgi:hypothetical protein